MKLFSPMRCPIACQPRAVLHAAVKDFPRNGTVWQATKQGLRAALLLTLAACVRPVSAEVRLLPPVDSRILKQARHIVVYLPPGYDSPASARARYPVLYLQDGQNCFDAKTAFLGREWQLDETANALIASGELPPLIMVGVYNESTRMDDYTPGPGAGRYIKFLADELKPSIDRQFRTKAGPADTAIMGSSMGGLVSTYAALTRPDIFGGSASLSAVFQFHGEALERLVRTGRKQPVRLYFDIGDDEVPGKGALYADDLREMRRWLLAAGYKEGTEFVATVIPGAQHNETYWAARANIPLRFLFPIRPHR